MSSALCLVAITKDGHAWRSKGKDIHQKMRTAIEGARKGTPPAEVAQRANSETLLKEVVHWLDEAKAEEITTIDLKGKSSLGDFMVIATGRSDRHVGAIAEQLRKHLKDKGIGSVRVEGLETCDWVLIDAVDILVHVFRAEVRDFYNLEKMWSAARPGDQTSH
jgi:ribosome-associated protein